MSIQKLNILIDNIGKDQHNLELLIDSKDEFTQEDWDYITENYQDIPEIVSNTFIIRKENLGKEIGMNFIINIYNQHYPEEFYAQTYIKELLDMDEEDYNDIMGSYQSLLFYGDQWRNLFYCKQWYFSNKFILENADHFISNHTLQRYQTVPIEFYEKYIDDERLEYVNIYDQDIPQSFIKKYIKTHFKKIGLTNIITVQGLTEELFIEFLSYKELNSEECQNSLWLTVGAYKISEQFIRNNLNKINRKYEDIFVINGYKCPWDLIVQNGVNYSEELIHENIKHINLKLLFSWSILGCEKKQYTPDFIKRYWNCKDVDIKDIMAQDSLKEMNDFVEKLLEEKKIKLSLINELENISLTLIEKYHSELDFEYVCHYNKNINIPFLVNNILKWYPELYLSVSTYLCIENASENNILFFINSYYKNYDEEEIQLFFKYSADIINNFPDKYSNNIKNIILNKNVNNDIIPKSNMTEIDSFDNTDVIYRHSLYHIIKRI